jgi:hypothetical protein
MTKKIILAIVVIFLIFGGLTIWIFSSFNQTTAETQARTEADFTTEHFTVKELWEMANKKDDQVLSSYLFIKVEQAPINLRLPWLGSEVEQGKLARKIPNGSNIEVKVLKSQLEAAQKNGAMESISRFIMGNKREVMVFKLTFANQTLVNRDIHDYDEAQVTLLNRMTSNPWMILIPGFILLYIIAYVKKRRDKKIPA